MTVWLQPQQTANLLRARVYDGGAHKVVRVGVDALQQLHAKAQEFGLDGSILHGACGLEDLLGLLSRPGRGGKEGTPMH